jgi:hypothetical protein
MAKKAKKAKKRSASGGAGKGHEMKLALALDAKKIAAIQNCIKKGRLTISISSVKGLGKGANGYLYD